MLVGIEACGTFKGTDEFRRTDDTEELLTAGNALGGLSTLFCEARSLAIEVGDSKPN